MIQALSNCWDFANDGNEQTAFHELLISRGHVPEMSPKCHPEVAGVEVEYSWGKSKMHFRRHTDHVARHLHDNIVASMSPEVLTLTRVRRYARKARAYRRAYSTSSTAMSRRSIEKQVKLYKRHRSALDIDWKFIINPVQKLGISILPPQIRVKQRVNTPLTAENEGQISRVSAHWVLNMHYGDI